MADKKKKSKKQSGADAVRGRATDLVEEITGAAQRMRKTLEDINVVEELKGLRNQVEQLADRVGALEVGGRRVSGGTAAKRAASPQSKFGAAKSAAKSTGTRAKTAAKSTRSATKSTGTRAKSTGTRAKAASKSTGTRAKSTAKKSTSTAKKSTSARKPAARRTSSASKGSSGRS